MRAYIVFLGLLAATLALSVETSHHGGHRTSHKANEKDIVTEEANKVPILPTLVSFKASSLKKEEEEASSEDNADKKSATFNTGKDKRVAVLLSGEELVDLLEKEEEEAEKQERADEEETEAEAQVETTQVEGVKNKSLENDKDEVPEVEMSPKEKEEEENVTLLDEYEGSTASTIAADYAGDSAIFPLPRLLLQKVKAHRDDVKPVTTTTGGKEEVFDDVMQNREATQHQGASSLDNTAKGSQNKTTAEMSEEKEHLEEDSAGQDDRGDDPSKKARKPKNKQRTRKHSPQREDKQDEQSQEASQETEGGRNNNNSTVQKAKRRRAGQWGPLVGVNPVQIRAKVDLYPSARPSPRPEAPPDLCDNIRCKRGKTCKLDADNKPSCVCQEPSLCPPSLNDFDHVCGTDNKTYNTSCELFATKCKLDGTKRGHRLHLDYTGPCKVIPPCVDTELVQFPLRMRDWLKNVLLQLYEHDSMSPGYLTSKQRFRVKKIFENERRLHAGDHSAELLAQDFEKNYNMYIYPVHWQFAQLDQHPCDRLLSHSELAPLRVPLVPMEHCTSRFFQECDADKDKQVSFTEWTSCFGIKNNDIDVNLLF
ncbi:SPARC-like protein 1 [Dunckerocampus dactyliophorus]|uniref:SPARC-like protein 1 n=1 Tax=Dunckerocampus dactyliophorus TaxID=161453 RepID=UPI002404CC95|nr:SPARC-like protein 1 [Dunckerocampus dactyliophorus]XP_054636365.1 SPARC-like protein 1 [Dunckerocampus dactyliophorus]